MTESIPPSEEKVSPREEKVSPREVKFRDLFRDRRFSVIKEVNLPEGKLFQTPLGNMGRHGWVLEEEGTGYRCVVGDTALRRAAKEFGSVDLPASLGRKSGTVVIPFE